MVGEPLHLEKFVGGAFGLELRFERLLACSPRALVWAATDGDTGRRYAVKVRARGDRSQTSRILREAASLARLDAPGIPRVIDVMTTPSHVAVAMPLLGGMPLTALDASTTATERGALALEAVAVVASVHAAGLVHDNLALENFFLAVAPDGTSAVHLTGFSSARIVDAGDASTWAGTAACVAPERPFSRPTTRTDVYALGGVLDHLLMRRSRGSARSTDVEMIRMHLRSCTAIDPSMRPESAVALARRLASCNLGPTTKRAALSLEWAARGR